jgi:hypothetical protein
LSEKRKKGEKSKLALFSPMPLYLSADIVGGLARTP